MASTITPEKVKTLLSSFLVKPNKSGESPSTASRDGASNQDKGNVGKKSETLKTSSSSTSSLRSHASFLSRLDTFSALTWFGKPMDLSPLICARYGWENVDTDMLQCVNCKAFLSGHLPRKTDYKAYETSLSKLKQNILASHDKFCVLAVNPCPEHFCHVPVDDPVSLTAGFTERATALSQIQDRLPRIDNVQLSALGSDEGQGGAYCKRNLMPESEISPQAVTLAFTGWTCSPSNKDVLMCSMCRRQIGLWNFLSANPLSISRGNSKENDSNGEDTEEGEPEAKKRRKISTLNVKETFNPIEEHNHWCPWIQPAPLPLSASPSVQSSPVTRTSNKRKTQQTAPACIVSLRTFAPGLMDNNTGLACAMKTSPMTEGLRCFRRVIKTWSSPKTQSSNASPS